jgi:hypothetical protein
LSGVASSAIPATSFSVTAKDSIGQASTQTFLLEVKDPPLVSTGTTASIVLYQYKQITPITPAIVVGGTVPYTFTITPDLTTSGLTVNSGTGIISGTPIVTIPETEYTVVVTDTSSPQQTTSSQFLLTVEPPEALTFSPVQTAFTLTIGTSYVGLNTITGNGGTGNLYYSIDPSLPTTISGLTFNTSTGVISGTPSILYTGTFNLTITDSAVVPQTTSTEISIAVVAKPITLTVQNTIVLTRYQQVSPSSGIIPVQASNGYGAFSYEVLPKLPFNLK